jgi:hypothetical protein
MDCSCDAEYPDVYSEKWQVARKPHECCECGSTIDRGERYIMRKGSWDGKWRSYRQCDLCAGVWDSEAQKYGDCIAFGEMWDYLGS